MSRRGWLLFATMGVIWGLPYLLIRISVREIEPATLVFFRTAPSALLLAPIAFRAPVRAALRRHWKVIVLYTCGELAVPWLCLSTAEQHLSSSVAGLLVAAVPLVSIILARLGGDEHDLAPKRLVGIALGFAGVAALVGLDLQGATAVSLIEATIVVFGYALGPYLVAHHLREVPAIGVITASFAITALCYAPFALTHLPRHLGNEQVLSVIGLVTVCTVAGFLIFFELMKEVGAERSTVITYVNPAVAILLGVTLLHEHFGLGIAIGFPLVLAGCYLATAHSAAPLRRVPELGEDETLHLEGETILPR